MIKLCGLVETNLLLTRHSLLGDNYNRGNNNNYRDYINMHAHSEMFYSKVNKPLKCLADNSPSLMYVHIQKLISL